MTAALLWIAAFFTTLGARLDRAVLTAFLDAGASPHVEDIARLADPRPFALLALVILTLALVRREVEVAAIAALILLAANAATQGLKIIIPRLVERPELAGSYDGFWPSGHSTAAMTLALCAVLAAGPRLRPVAAAFGAGYAVAVGYALIASGSHLPSDVLGGYLVAASFALLGAAALRPQHTGKQTQAAARTPLRTSIVAPAAGALAVVAVAASAVLADGLDTARLVEDASAVAAGASIAALGVTLIAGLTLTLHH